MDFHSLPRVVIADVQPEGPHARIFIMAQVCSPKNIDGIPRGALVIRSTVPGAEEEHYMALVLELQSHQPCLIFRRGHGQIVVFDHSEQLIEIASSQPAVREHAPQLFKEAYPGYRISLIQSH